MDTMITNFAPRSPHKLLIFCHDGTLHEFSIAASVTKANDQIVSASVDDPDDAFVGFTYVPPNEALDEAWGVPPTRMIGCERMMKDANNERWREFSWNVLLQCVIIFFSLISRVVGSISKLAGSSFAAVQANTFNDNSTTLYSQWSWYHHCPFAVILIQPEKEIY